MIHKKSHSIIVYVEPQFLDEQSSPEKSKYLWAYHVKIENFGEVSVILKSRVWQIIDNFGHLEEIAGEGVIGEQPLLNPGEAYEYSSVISINTPAGIMQGTYQMVTETGELIEVEIPAFSLDSPFDLKTIH